MTNSASEDEQGRARKTAEELLAEAARKHAPAHRDPCIRAESEDDDGYDPYSDRQETNPLFERDPGRRSPERGPHRFARPSIPNIEKAAAA